MFSDKKRLLVFGGALIGVSMVYFFCITFLAVPESGQKYADIILGFLLGTMCASVINFFFGSSEGSKDKDKAR